MSERETESQHAARTDNGGVEVDIEDAGGRELRDVGERPPDEEVQEIEEERSRRLESENRPDNAEVDNTHRDFDPAVGMFTDTRDYDEADGQFAADEEGED